MTTKSLVRFAIGLVIALILLCLILPPIGVPRAQIFPPFYGYQNATGTTRGQVTKVYTSVTGNPFKVGEGERWYLVDYAFTAPAGTAVAVPVTKPPPAGQPTKFTGTVRVNKEDHAKFKAGEIVPIRYERTYPTISGINLPHGGRNGASGSGVISGWIIWALVTLVLGYLIAGALERLLLRESY